MSSLPQEQVIAAYQNAPAPVREAFGSEVTANLVMEMKTKYRLHIDVAGNLGNDIGYMLLGLRSPAEFFGNLMLSGADEKTARAIMEEVNQRLFLPLKRQMSGTPESPIKEGEYVAAPQPAPKPAVTAPITLEYEPPTPTLPGSPEPAPMPAQPIAPETVSVPTPTPVVEPRIPVQPTPIHKDFGADPYREPI